MCITSRCIVPGCTIPTMPLFSFPANNILRYKWVAAIPNIKETLPDSTLDKGFIYTILKNYKVCSAHFKDNQFYTIERKKLLPKQVPLIFNLGSDEGDADDLNKNKNFMCSVEGCDTFSKVEEDCSLFRFPKDEDRCKKWCIAIGKEKLLEEPREILYENNRVCSRHFSLELFTSKRRVCLINHAVPNQMIPSQPCSDRESRELNNVKNHLMISGLKKKVITGGVKANIDNDTEKVSATLPTLINRIVKFKKTVKSTVITNTLKHRINELQQIKVNLRRPIKIKTQKTWNDNGIPSNKQGSARINKNVPKILKPSLKQNRMLKKINTNQNIVNDTQQVVVKKIGHPGSLKPTVKVVQLDSTHLVPVHRNRIPLKTDEQGVKYRMIKIPRLKQAEVIKSLQNTKQGVVRDCLLQETGVKQEIVINSGKENENSNTQHDIVTHIAEKSDLENSVVINNVIEEGKIKNKQSLMGSAQHSIVKTDVNVINKPNYGVKQNGGPPRVVKTDIQVINKPNLGVPNIINTEVQINKPVEQNSGLQNLLKIDIQRNKSHFSVEQNGGLQKGAQQNGGLQKAAQQNSVIVQKTDLLQDALILSDLYSVNNTNLQQNETNTQLIPTYMQNDSVNNHQEARDTIKIGAQPSAKVRTIRQYSPKTKSVNVTQDPIARSYTAKTINQNLNQTRKKNVKYPIQKNKVNGLDLNKVIKNMQYVVEKSGGVKNDATKSSTQYISLKTPEELGGRQLSVVVHNDQNDIAKTDGHKTLVPQASIVYPQQNTTSQNISEPEESIVISGTQQSTVQPTVSRSGLHKGVRSLQKPVGNLNEQAVRSESPNAIILDTTNNSQALISGSKVHVDSQSIVNKASGSNGSSQILAMRLQNSKFKSTKNPVFIVKNGELTDGVILTQGLLPPTTSNVGVQTDPKMTNCPTYGNIQKIKREIRKIKNHLRIDKSIKEEDLTIQKTLSIKDFPSELSLLGKLHLRGKNIRGMKYTEEYIETLLKIYLANSNWYRLIGQSLQFSTVNELKNLIYKVYVKKNDEELLYLIDFKSKNFKNTAKDCVLCIDIKKIKPHLFYNIKKDEIIGLEHRNNGKGDEPAQYVLIYMLRGIHQNWTQLLGYMFISSNHQLDLKNMIFNYISTLQNLNLYVKAIVTSTEPIFYNLAKELKISPEKPYFKLNEEVIFYIFDAPSLLVTLRDVFLKNIFKYKGCIIDKKYIKQIPSFTPGKLNLKVREKDFKNAAQLFSNKTADFMNCFISCGVLPTESQTTVDFIQNINNLFDILNSSSEEGYKFKKPLSEEYQIDYLNNMVEMFDKIETNNFDVKNNFWCWKITIVSTFQLFHGSEIKNLQTRRLNLFPLQLLFDKRKPTPVRFRVRFRKEFVKNLFCTEGTKFSRVNDLLKHLDTLYVNQKVIQCNIRPVEFLKLDDIDLDYRILDLKDNVMFFISGYLLYKCLLQVFNCENCRLYALKQNVDMSYLNAAFNTNSLNTESTDNSFYNFIQKLENLFILHIKEALTQKGVGNYLLVLMQEVKLNHPCSKFPLNYLYTLFVRLRMFFVLKFANRELWKKGERKQFIVKELCESFD